MRHGQTDANLNHIIQGQTDTPLNETGLFQAQRVAEELKSVPAELVLSSDLSRAAQTAKIIARACDVPLMFDKKLREMSLGIWEGKRFKEIENTPLSNIWFEKPSQLRLEGAERVEKVQERMVSAIFGALKQYRTLIVVSHGLAIALFILYVNNLPLDSMWKYLVDNASVSKIILSGELVNATQSSSL